MKFHNKMRIVWWLLLVVFMLLTVFMATGCEVLKLRRESKADSTHVSKQNTDVVNNTSEGSIKKTEQKSKDDYELWRMIVPGRDTTINNFFTQPIVYEHIKGVKEETKNTTDSTWMMNVLRYVKTGFDSVNFKMQVLERNKHVETKGLGLWMMVLVVAGTYLVLQILGYSIRNFQIIKKSKS